MKHAVRAVFFDLGNTLMFDRDPWADLYQRADDELWNSLQKAGVRSSPGELYPGENSLFHYYYKLRANDLDEPGIMPTLRQLLDEHDIKISDPDLRSAIRSMYEVTQTNWYPEEDAAPTLQALRESGLRLGIISNGADDDNTITLIDKGNLGSFFDVVISSAAVGKRKPDPLIFQTALDHFRLPAEAAVMIGDSYEADILGGHQAGLQTVWITRRINPVLIAYDIEPDATVATLVEIPSLLAA